MQCQDNSRLRIPLPEVCDTPDIGCVPITFGKPNCAPQPDQLPFAFDPKTTTLWLYNCRTHEWLEFRKFRLCNDLIEINVDNLNNICELLQIPVFFNAGNGCQEGWITLQEFSDQIKKCFHLKWRAVCLDVTEGEEGTLKIDIQNFEDALPPWYIKFKNIWPICGTGEEDDPVILETYDPICEWPVKTFEDVKAAKVKHLGACLDDEMVRVPFPPPPCSFPQYTREQVEAAGDKDIIMCVDNRHVKVQVPPAFFLPPPCWFPQITREEVENAQDKDIIMCVDGRHVKIQVPPAFFLPPPCWFPQFTRAQVDNGRDKDIIICVDGQHAKIPVPPAFFVPEYICVPEVTETPTQPPAEGTGPIRVDCDGNIYFWLCDTQIWFKVHTGITGIDKVVDLEADIANKCDDVAFKAWITQDGQTKKKEASVTLGELAQHIFECVTPDDDPVDCDFGNRFNIWLSNISGSDTAQMDTTHIRNTGNFTYYVGEQKACVVSSRDGRILMGRGWHTPTGKVPGGAPRITIRNTSCVPRTYLFYTKLSARRRAFAAMNYAVGGHGIITLDPSPYEYTRQMVNSKYGKYMYTDAQGAEFIGQQNPNRDPGLPFRTDINGFNPAETKANVNYWMSFIQIERSIAYNHYFRDGETGQSLDSCARSVNVFFMTLHPGMSRSVQFEVNWVVSDVALEQNEEVDFLCQVALGCIGFNSRLLLDDLSGGD